MENTLKNVDSIVKDRKLSVRAKALYFSDDIPIPSVSEIIKPIQNKTYNNIDKNMLEITSYKKDSCYSMVKF